MTGESGYFFQTDEHPIQMVEAGAGPGALYITGTNWNARGENPFTVTVWNLIIRVSDHLYPGEINLI